jgi:hypothetical protein
VKTLASFLKLKVVGGSQMDIGALSMIMSQSKVQQSAGIAVMKMAMDTGKQSGTQITEMIKNVTVDPNVGQHLDVRA